MMKSELLDQTGHEHAKALISKTLKEAHPVVILLSGKRLHHSMQSPQRHILIYDDKYHTDRCSERLKSQIFVLCSDMDSTYCSSWPQSVIADGFVAFSGGKFISKTVWDVRCLCRNHHHTLRDCLTYLDVVFWHQSNLPFGVLCFNPAASNILKLEWDPRQHVNKNDWDWLRPAERRCLYHRHKRPG